MNPLFACDAASGLLHGLPYRPSPHRDARPAPDVSLLVLHGISLPPGSFDGDAVEALFAGTLDCDAHPAFAELRAVRVSAHLYVRRDGSAVQFVPLHERAWHAGVSQFGARARCNDFSIGIELQGTDMTAYTPAQYATAAALTRAIRAAYPAITAERIVGHSDIAPGRKTDPGPAFDWAVYRAAIAA